MNHDNNDLVITMFKQCHVFAFDLEFFHKGSKGKLAMCDGGKTNYAMSCGGG